jgi:hypothetical protein
MHRWQSPLPCTQWISARHVKVSVPTRNRRSLIRISPLWLPLSDEWLAVFAGSEMALVSLRDSQLRRLERTTRSGPTLARLPRHVAEVVEVTGRAITRVRLRPAARPPADGSR